MIQDCQTDPVYILTDGIDGLKGSLHRELRRILALMNIRTIKMIFSSRNVPHIANNFSSGSFKFNKINLDVNDFVKKDVEAFIRYRVNGLGY